MTFKPQITNNTLVDLPRLQTLEFYLKQTSNLTGLVAEVGVYKGGTAYLICETTTKPVLLFDTFRGMPQVSLHDTHETGDFDDTSLEAVQLLLSEFNPIIIQGIFPQDNGSAFRDCKFSFVHLDCDIYDSVKECLQFFYPKMTPNGVIVLDDYNEPNCPGAKLAVDEFLSDKSDFFVETIQSQAMIIKS